MRTGTNEDIKDCFRDSDNRGSNIQDNTANPNKIQSSNTTVIEKGPQQSAVVRSDDANASSLVNGKCSSQPVRNQS